MNRSKRQSVTCLPASSPLLPSVSQESFPFLSHSGGRAWHAVSVDRYALAVTERAPFTIEITPPRIPLIRKGSLDLDVRIQLIAASRDRSTFKRNGFPAGSWTLRPSRFREITMKRSTR